MKIKTQIQTSNTGFMPRPVAITLLTSKYSKTNPFRKRCVRATERVCEPVSRSTALNVSAPKTGSQKLQARLAKANAKQLLTWQKRTLRRGEKYQDLLFETQAKLVDAVCEDMNELWATEEALLKQIAAHDALCEAIHNELTRRATRGIGYRRPVKFIKAAKVKSSSPEIPRPCTY